MLGAEQRRPVLEVLERLDYRRGPGVSGELVSYQATFARRDRGGVTHLLDAHWRASDVQAFAAALPPREFAARSIPVPALGPHARMPAPAHALLIACLHRVAHRRAPWYSEGGEKHYGVA